MDRISTGEAEKVAEVRPFFGIGRGQHVAQMPLTADQTARGQDR